MEPFFMKLKTKIAILNASIAFLTIPTLFWLGGFNFDTRGPDATFCFLLTYTASIAAFALTKMYPGMK